MVHAKEYYSRKRASKIPITKRKIGINEIDDMLSLLEGIYDCGLNKKEDYYIQIALIHLLVGFRYENTKYSEANIKINNWIYNLRPIIDEYRIKYCHGKV